MRSHPAAELDGLLRAGLAHLWFLTRHPYEDGNGRLARAITDRLLAQDCRANVQQGLSVRALGISAQISREREGYYTVLERCQREDLDFLVEPPSQRLQRPATETA